MVIMVWTLFFLGPTATWSKDSTKKDRENSSNSSLEKALAEYARATHLSFSIEKRVKSELLLTETIRKGNLKIEKDRFRFELYGEPQTLMVYDGKSIWVIEGNSATHAKANPKNHPEIALFNRIFFSNSLSEVFDITPIQSKSADAKTKIFSLKPKNSTLGLQDIQIHLTGDKLTQLSYRDELDSLTEIQILKEQRLGRSQKNTFRFKPGSEMKVNNL
jgi:outer membrane lipoprotein-sorting protein